jgi:hypothetical protein
MESRPDSLAKQVSAQASRRRLVQSLAVLGVGTLGFIGLEQGADADRRDRCKERCQNHCNPNKTKKECRRDCRDRCRK